MVRLTYILIFLISLFSTISGQQEKLLMPDKDFNMDIAGIDSTTLNEIKTQENIINIKHENDNQIVINYKFIEDTLILLTKEHIHDGMNEKSVVFRSFLKNLKLNKYLLLKKTLLIEGQPILGIMPPINHFINSFKKQTNCKKKHLKLIQIEDIKYAIINSQFIEIEIQGFERSLKTKSMRNQKLKTKNIYINTNSFPNSSDVSGKFYFCFYIYCEN